MPPIVYRITLIIILLLLHAWNCYQLYIFIDHIRQSKVDLSFLIYLFYWVPFTIVSLAGVLTTLGLLQLTKRTFFWKPLYIVLIVSLSLSLIVVALVADLVSGAGIFTLLALGLTVLLIRFALKKLNPEGHRVQPGLLLLLPVSAVLAVIGVFLDSEIMPVSLHTGLLFLFILLLVVMSAIHDKSKYSMHLPWGWTVAAIAIFIANDACNEWWLNGHHRGREYFGPMEEYTMCCGRRVGVETTFHPNGKPGRIITHNPEFPELYTDEELDIHGRRTYYSYDSVIENVKVRVRHDWEYNDASQIVTYFRGVDGYQIGYYQRIHFFADGKKKVLEKYNQHYPVRYHYYRYDTTTGEIIDSTTSDITRPHEWYKE